jgi:predicted Zn-dependent protease
MYAEQDDFTSAVKIIQTGLKCNPKSPLMRYQLAAYLIFDDRYEEGFETLNETTAMYPNDRINFFELYKITANKHKRKYTTKTDAS